MGEFIGIKGFVKYILLYGAFSLADAAGYPISNESIGDFFETLLGRWDFDQPIAVFAAHVNNISPQQALAEGAGIFATGLAVKAIGKKMKCI